MWRIFTSVGVQHNDYFHLKSIHFCTKCCQTGPEDYAPNPEFISWFVLNWRIYISVQLHFTVIFLRKSISGFPPWRIYTSVQVPIYDIYKLKNVHLCESYIMILFFNWIIFTSLRVHYKDYLFNWRILPSVWVNYKDFFDLNNIHLCVCLFLWYFQLKNIHLCVSQL